MMILPQEMLPDKTNLVQDAEERLSDGLRILARIIACAYLDSNGQVGKKEETAGRGTHGVQRRS